MLRPTILLCLPLLVSAADVTGRWTVRLIQFGEETPGGRMELKSEGAKITGTLNELKIEGALDGDRLRFTGFSPDGKECCTFEARLQGRDLTGTGKQGGDEFAWKACLVKEAPTAARQPRMFEPAVLHRNSSVAVP